VGTLPRHRDDGRGERVRQRATAVGVRARYRWGAVRRRNREFYDLTLDALRIAVDRAAARQMAGLPVTPPFHFGGLSEPAREVAAQAADVYLM